MKTQHWRTLVLAGAFCSGVLSPAYGQWPITKPETSAGPWEVTDSSVGDGIFLYISTPAKVTANKPVGAGQRVQIRVSYQRDGQKTWGWYVAAPADVLTVFDGQHLRIRRSQCPRSRSDISPGSAAVDRHVDAGRPTAGRRPPKPRPLSTVAPNSWRGTWEGVQDASGNALTRLHIDQSSDGTLMGWMDRDFGPYQRYGELLAITALEGNTITLSTTAPAGRRYRFRGSFSADGLQLSGSWAGDDGGGGTLNASDSFRRLP
jgi:hypothetical protein